MSRSDRGAGEIYLAADLGASSGRIVAGHFQGDVLSLSDVHRFENGPVHALGRMYWDFYRQWTEVQSGLGLAASRYGSSIRSLGVDTWGVDFGLLGPGDELLGSPRHYRDPRTRGALDRAFREVSRADIFAATGLQFMELNTLYQLLAIRDQAPELLHQARRFLMMPDLFHWHLTGALSNERTNASTTQLFDPRQGNWSFGLLDRFHIPTGPFAEICPPGTDLGPVRRELAERLGLGRQVRVIAPGTHDTASAVLAVPSDAPFGAMPDWCYISSGTWSLMGVEMSEPVITDRCRELNFTNEAGIGGTTRLLRNIAGLWLVQECRRAWGEQGQVYSWPELTQLASQAKPLARIINPDHPSLIAPTHMPDAMVELCRASHQSPPETPGEFVRCALESLAMRYRVVLGWLEQLIGRSIERVHIVGGGTQNQLLCQLAADACQRTVIAGPVEATALGNIAMQMVSSGAVDSISQARDVIRRSFPVETYSPRTRDAWDALDAKFGMLFRG